MVQPYCILSGDTWCWVLLLVIKFDQLVKAVSDKFTHYKVTILPFEINKSFVEQNFETKYLQDIYPIFH